MNGLKNAVVSVIGGVVVTLVTGLVNSTPTGLVGGTWFGLPWAWLVRQGPFSPPQFFAWVVDYQTLLLDFIVWIIVVFILSLIVARARKR